MDAVANRVRPTLELVGGSASNRAALARLSLDFDVRSSARQGAATQIALVLASGDTCRQAIEELRSRTDAPAIVLFEEADVAARISALEAGADEIIVGAIDTAELLARLRAHVRRSLRLPAEIIRFADLEIDVGRRTIRRGDRDIALSRLELDILLSLARRDGAVVSHSTLIREVWGTAKNMACVHTFISYLRAKLESHGEPRLVQTVSGVGYALRTRTA